MVERCEAVVDIPKIDTAGSRTEASTRIMMRPLEAMVQENFEVGAKCGLALASWDRGFALFNETLLAS